VNILSYERLNKDKEFEMKKLLLIGMIAWISLNAVSCDPDGGSKKEEETTGNSYNGKTVDQKFWGKWEYGDYDDADIEEFMVTITETTLFDKQYGKVSEFPAWSEGDIIYYFNNRTNITNSGILKDNSKIDFGGGCIYRIEEP
jgi:hypothetical protein